MEHKGRVTICSSIPAELHDVAEKNGWSWRQVFIKGIQAMQEYPQLHNRLLEVEEGNKKLLLKLTYYVNRVWQLEEKYENKKRN